MATANEKILAGLIHDLTTHVMGLIDDDASLDLLLKIQEAAGEISMQEERKGMSHEDRYYYSGCNILDMRENERPNVCEFVITHYGKDVLHLYYDRKLQFILQPNGDGFSIACRRPLCGRAQLRNYFAKLAKTEEANPGAYAEKWYVPKAYMGQPTIFRDKPAETNPKLEMIEEEAS